MRKVKTKALILAAAFAAFFTPTAQAFFPQIVPLRALCVSGSPEPLLMKLLEQYNEVPKYTMQLTVDSPKPILMIVTENENNPSSTVLLVNPNLDLSCVFYTAKDTLKDTGAKSLPEKMPLEDGKFDV
tara:strand:- start:238 stop:621 length:384 start_codon:yes stop_codon:yes gene_type:complete